MSDLGAERNNSLLENVSKFMKIESHPRVRYAIMDDDSRKCSSDSSPRTTC